MTNQYEGPVPSGPYTKLWGKDKYSDVTVRLLSDAADGSEIVYEELAVHEVALVDGSEYFKGLFTTGAQMSAPPTKKQRTVTDPESRASADDTSCQCKPRPEFSLLCSKPEQAQAFKTVITFLYTHELPGSLTPAALQQIVTTADYLGAPECIKACTYKLASMHVGRADIEQLHNLLQMLSRCLPASCSLIETVELTLETALLEHYGEARAVITDTAKLDDFCQLPSSCVELLGASDRLLVDSESSVVVLLNHWWQRQAETTEKMRQKLSALVRLSSLSRSYLIAMDKLAWYVEPFPGAGALCLTMPTITENTFKNTQYNTLKLKPRQSYSQKASLELGWQISVESVENMVIENKLLSGPRGYSHGYMWATYLCWQSEQLLFCVELQAHSCGIESAVCVADVIFRDNVSKMAPCPLNVPFKVGGPGCSHVLEECSRALTGLTRWSGELMVKTEIFVTS